MKCLSCSADTSADAKFCAECGKPITPLDSRHKSEIDIDWIDSLFRREAYETEPLDGAKNAIIARSTNNPTIIIKYLPEQNLIAFQAMWSHKKITWGQKYDYLDTVTKAAMQRWMVSITSNTELDSVVASGALWLCEKTSDRDIIGFAKTFSNGALSALAAVNFSKFS